MYRPNFCAECGAHIERTRWRLWTSRRFCPVCEKRFRKTIFVWLTLTTFALLGAGFLFGRAGRPAAPPLIVERGKFAAMPVASNNHSPQASSNSANDNSASTSEPRPTPFVSNVTSGETPTDPNETVSLCGARTQKGTPCQRRVRGTGRCWQHRGKPAMLPPSKLIVPA
ncbi:MAG: hypothetical protein H0V88_05480 [Pyrinomonadaceae bacterium]|nr:hypothetical protein [Pyrinomonadaceae bacterium]